MPRYKDNGNFLTGKLLIAMPQLDSPPFNRSVVYVCAHSPEGAMGLVINRLVNSLSFGDLLRQLEIETADHFVDRRIYYGGPVETSRGFVLHSTDRMEESTMLVDDDIALTSTVDILRAMVEGDGPRRSLLALGYAGWGPGQLDQELHENSWLHVEADDALLFDQDVDSKWHRSIAKIGININMLSGEAGHA